MDIVCFSTAVSLLPIEFGPDPFLFKILSLHTELHNMNHLWMCLAARMHVLSFQDPSSNLWWTILRDLRVRKFFSVLFCVFFLVFFAPHIFHYQAFGAQFLEICCWQHCSTHPCWRYHGRQQGAWQKWNVPDMLSIGSPKVLELWRLTYYPEANTLSTDLQTLNLLVLTDMDMLFNFTDKSICCSFSLINNFF